MEQLVTRFDKDAYRAAEHKLEGRTLFMDKKRGQQIMWVDGYLSLPVGAIVELAEPVADTTVVGVRLLAGSDQKGVTLCVELDVPESFWKDIDKEWERQHPGQKATVYGNHLSESNGADAPGER